MLSCTGPLALPGGRSVFKAGHICQRSGLALVARASRKQSQKQSRDVGVDLASGGLPADLDKLSKLAKAELQHQLEVRGLDKDGNKEELASRLLDNLIAQESVLSTNPPDRVKLQQQLEQGRTAGRRGRRTSRKATASADPQPESSSVGSPQAADSVIAAAMTAEPSVEVPAAAAAAAAGSRRGRKTSRKATSSVDPLPSAAEIAAGAAAEPVRRGRKTSRRATTSADPLPAAPVDVLAASPSAAAEGASADAKSARRGRKTSRKATTSAEPSDAPASHDPVVAAAEAAAVADGATESLISKQRGRRSSKTTAADPSPAAAAPTEEAAPAKAGRGRRASRRSSVLEPESTDAAPSAAASAEGPARQRGRRTSSAKTATSGGAAADEAAPAPSTAAEAPVSRAKLLAQQLAKKEIATHGQGAAGAAGAAAAPGSAWVGVDELLYAGSQAQSDNLLMSGDNSMQAVGAESSFTIDNGSVDEVMAQISAERAAGLADEPQLRPEATLSSNFEGMMNPPSAGAADAAASWGAATATGADADADAAAGDSQHPSLTDCVAAVEEPLTAAAEAVEVDEAPDAAMAAFDHMYVHIASPGAAEADLQHPNLSDCVAAVEEPLPAQADPAPLVVVDEAPDAAMAAFDHTSLDTPAAAAVAGGNQTPSLQDIALAVESSPLPPSLDESLGEDEEPDVALAAFDHIDVPAPAAAAAAAVVTDDGAAAAAAGGYDQAYLDPLQPSATVGSGSVDLADAEVVVTAAAAPVTAAAAAAPAKQLQAQQQQQQKAGAGQGAPDLSVMVQRWWASVVAMFEDWQKNLSGPK